NLVNFGILPLLFADEADYDRIAQGDRLTIPNVRAALEGGETLTVENRTKHLTFAVKHTLSTRQRALILAGGALNASCTS
ncbi:MAG TPA: aconitate hydratase, partial [Syntrophales bacterium]|nr:aconitate hydratase [Syntrophales bacterium]